MMMVMMTAYEPVTCPPNPLNPLNPLESTESPSSSSVTPPPFAALALFRSVGPTGWLICFDRVGWARIDGTDGHSGQGQTLAPSGLGLPGLRVARRRLCGGEFSSSSRLSSLISSSPSPPPRTLILSFIHSLIHSSIYPSTIHPSTIHPSIHPSIPPPLLSIVPPSLIQSLSLSTTLAAPVSSPSSFARQTPSSAAKVQPPLSFLLPSSFVHSRAPLFPLYFAPPTPMVAVSLSAYVCVQ